MNKAVAMKYYNMVKDSVIRNKLIKNFDEDFDEFSIVDEGRPNHLNLCKCINDWFSWRNSPEWHKYWSNLVSRVHDNKIELKTWIYDL